MVRLRHILFQGFPVCVSLGVCPASRLPPPSSNRTCGFPASGFHVNSCRQVVHGLRHSLNRTAQPGSQKRAVPQPLGRGFRKGTRVQAELLPSYPNMLTFRPLRSTVVTRFPATMGLSDSRPEPLPGLWIPPGRWRSPPPPRRASQVPRRICPRAPSTSTPESSAAASAHCFTTDGKLHPKGKTSYSQMNPLTRPNRFAFAMAHEFAFPGFASRIAPTHAGSATCMNRQFTWSAPHS